MDDGLEPESLANQPAHVQHARRFVAALEQRVPFCGLTEQMVEEARRRQLQWANKSHLKWYIADRLPGIPLDVLTAIYARAWGAWQKVCGLTFSQTSSSGQADLIILTRPIDGSGGTLAEHELPPGNDRPLRGWFDLQDQWHADRNFAPPPQNKIDLLAVATHEFGHGIGLGHEQSRPITALMDPYYSPQIREPQAWDIQQAQARYGRPIEPVPDEPEPPPGARNVQMIIDGVSYRPTVIHPA